MQQQGQEWADRVKSGKLSRCNVWFIVDYQFWPRVGYCICNTSATWEELNHCLKRVYWQIVPRGGVQGSAAVPFWQLHCGFYRIGCPHPGVECLVAQITKLLVHYRCQSDSDPDASYNALCNHFRSPLGDTGNGSQVHGSNWFGSR